MGLLIAIIVITILVGAIVWRRELGALLGRMWLYSVILKDVCLGKSPRSDLRDTREYRAYRSMKAALELDDFLSSAELALFSACNLKSRQKYHIPLWELREHYYFIDLALREVKCQSGNSITATTIRVVLEEFRDVYPDYDPYMCFRLRLTDAENLVEDFNKMED
jgi:hypothetical protein